MQSSSSSERPDRRWAVLAIGTALGNSQEGIGSGTLGIMARQSGSLRQFPNGACMCSMPHGTHVLPQLGLQPQHAALGCLRRQHVTAGKGPSITLYNARCMWAMNMPVQWRKPLRHTGRQAGRLAGWLAGFTPVCRRS